MEPAVRAQVQGSFSSLMGKIAAPGLAATELAAEYGAAGKLFMVAEELESAEPCFLNAATLTPGDARWTYYLGYLYKRSRDLDRAAASFEGTLAVQPDNIAALWWLASVRLELGRAADAEPLLFKALALQPGAWQTLYALGRTSLLRRDYAAAAQYFERTLAVNPRATPAHYQLGLAYRALGKRSEAEVHLRQHVEEEIRPQDPLMTELDGLLQTSVAYHSRAVQAARSGDWTGAVEYFAKAAELDPRNAGVRLDVGIALYRSGHAREAFEQIQEALRISPQFARAHYVAGMLMVESGRDREAIDAFMAATTFDANFIEAYISLAQTLQRTGRPRDALAQYHEVLTRAPADSEGQFGSAVALIRLGR
jgi:tetratricopeptide (TPR) repeat protein